MTELKKELKTVLSFPTVQTTTELTTDNKALNRTDEQKVPVEIQRKYTKGNTACRM